MSDHHIHPSPAVRVIVAREVAAERERIAQAIEAERDLRHVGSFGMVTFGSAELFWPDDRALTDAARIAREPKP